MLMKLPHAEYFFSQTTFFLAYNWPHVSFDNIEAIAGYVNSILIAFSVFGSQPVILLSYVALNGKILKLYSNSSFLPLLSISLETYLCKMTHQHMCQTPFGFSQNKTPKGTTKVLRQKQMILLELSFSCVDQPVSPWMPFVTFITTFVVKESQ